MAKRLPLFHLEEGIYLQVDGDEEKNHSLRWDVLKKIGDNTQTLITKLARYSFEDQFLDLENIKLDFVGFFPGSAIPQFRMHASIQSNLFPVRPIYDSINSDFTFVISHLNDGNFQAIADKYNEPTVKNDIIETVFDFSNSAGTRPFRIVRPTPKTKSGFAPIAKVRAITPTVRNLLRIAELSTPLPEKAESIEAVSKVLIKTNSTGRRITRIGNIYTQKEAGLSLKFDSIETAKRYYQLRGEVFFNLEQSKTSVTIESPMLDIYALGETIADAEKDMFQQFDYTYQRLNEIDDDKLSETLATAKKYINLIVDTVKEK